MISESKCPECKTEGPRVPTTTQKYTDRLRLYMLPCYFCVKCHHEELVPKDQIQAWADAYWDVLPSEIRPPSTSKGGAQGSPTSGFPDYI